VALVLCSVMSQESEQRNGYPRGEIGCFDFVFPLQLHNVKEISFDNVISFTCVYFDG